MKKNFKITVLFSLIVCVFLSVASFASGIIGGEAGTWVQVGNNWKYQKTDGTFVTSNWCSVLTGGSNLVSYYFNADGIMATGIVKIGNDYYSFNADGSPQSNSEVSFGDKSYKTKERGRIVDNRITEDFVNQYNADFAIKNAPKSAEQIAAEQAAKAQAEAEAAAAAEAKQTQDANAEKYGPKAVAGQKQTQKEVVGPGQGL